MICILFNLIKYSLSIQINIFSFHFEFNKLVKIYIYLFTDLNPQAIFWKEYLATNNNFFLKTQYYFKNDHGLYFKTLKYLNFNMIDMVFNNKNINKYSKIIIMDYAKEVFIVN